MKKLALIATVLALVVSANAALFDNFNDGDVSDWTVIQSDASNPIQTYNEGGGDYCVYKNDFNSAWGVIGKSVGESYSGTMVSFQATIRSDGLDGRPSAFGLVDASGKGVIFSNYGGSNYFSLGTYTTQNWGKDYNNQLDNAVDASCTTTQDHVVRWDLNLATGAVNIYFDGTLRKTGTESLAGASSMTTALIVTKKKTYIDDLSVTPEPATMALMGFGGLGMLSRRKK